MVELITVIAIIGILMSLLLPAVQAARESSRRSRCQTRQRQLAIAMINYASQKTDFPHGAIQSTGIMRWVLFGLRASQAVETTPKRANPSTGAASIQRFVRARIRSMRRGT